MTIQTIINILDNCRHHADNIPLYAFGDNAAACEMNHLLRQIGSDIDVVIEELEKKL